MPLQKEEYFDSNLMVCHKSSFFDGFAHGTFIFTFKIITPSLWESPSRVFPSFFFITVINNCLQLVRLNFERDTSSSDLYKDVDKFNHYVSKSFSMIFFFFK